MKLTLKLFFLLAVILISASCDKTKAQRNDLEGTWELRNVMGYLRSGSGVDYAPGNNLVIMFEGNNFKEVNDTYINKDMSFEIVKDEATLNGVKLKFKIAFSERFEEHPHFKISGKTLALYYGDPAAEGVRMTYQKVR